ncbi:unnamed protein product [Brassica napus]|uniref:(rape) hypothetical protein n=1 Tax=Brassica napus TaxID=3708 RepID=A0A816LK24_BRANA|nr:unnamed protein product [Brassica napus]
MSPITKFDVNLRFQFAGSSVSFRFDSSTLSIEATAATPFKSVENCSEEEGIKEFRVKIMSDLKMEREISPVKPWKLIKRGDACKEPAEERIVNPSPRKDSSRVVKEKGGVLEAKMTVLPKFSVKL